MQRFSRHLARIVADVRKYWLRVMLPAFSMTRFVYFLLFLAKEQV